MRICEIEGCDKEHHAKGLCKSHYNKPRRWRYKAASYAYSRKWRANNLDRARESERRSQLRRWYGLTFEQREQMWLAQDKTCTICKQLLDLDKVHIDHDHTCCPTKKTCGKCIRGLLCNNCNHLLGLAKDSKAILLAAVEYLDECAS